jgi:RNA polymerase sigma-70 factor (ECF subfamily)
MDAETDVRARAQVAMPRRRSVARHGTLGYDLRPMGDQAITPPDLARAIAAAWEGGRRAWPGVNLEASVFRTFLLARLLNGGLEGLHTDDLYLTCACLAGDAVAERSFVEICLPVVRKALARIDPTGSLDDEVLQGLLTRLLAADADVQPRLALFNGRSALRGWVRVAAVRQALNLLRSVRRERQLDGESLLELVSADNQELSYIRETYRDAFKRSFHRVLARLGARDRNLLTLQLVDGLSLEQIGEFYQVNRSTVCRWLQSVRDRVGAETRAALMEELNVDREELESILTLVLSRFDASLGRVLGNDRG